VEETKREERKEVKKQKRAQKNGERVQYALIDVEANLF
jgi:hypothetical protein